MPVNLQLQDGNFSLGPEEGFFYSLNTNLNALIQLESDGSVVNTFPISLSQLRGPIKQLHYDGTFFWTLEDLPSNLGIVIKKWRLYPFKTFPFPNAVPTEFRWQDEMSLIHGPNIRWEADAFAVEHYHRKLDGSFIRGASTISLDSVDHLNAGDTIYLGPSDFGGFIGNEESHNVIHVDTATRDVLLDFPLQNSYVSEDPVDYSQSVFIFNKHAFTGVADNKGQLIQFAWPEKSVSKSDSGGKYGSVHAADFDGNNLCWVRSTQILQLPIFSLTFDLQSSLEANLVQDDFFTVIIVYDLVADLNNNLFLKLQHKETTENVSLGSFITTDFTPLFNFQTQSTLPTVNSIALDFDTRFSKPFPSSDRIKIQATVRDQFSLPVLGKSVQFSALLNADSPAGAPGTFSPLIGVTTSSGTVSTVYTPSSSTSNVLVDISAKVL